MAMIKCPECGNMISDKAEKCPHCGVSMNVINGGSGKQKKVNNKMLLIIIGAAVAVVIATVVVYFVIQKLNEPKPIPYQPYQPAVTAEPVSRYHTVDNVVYGTEYDYLSERDLSWDEIYYLSRDEMDILRNSIFARHGRYFQKDKFIEFFSDCEWYEPWRSEVPSHEFNKHENHNISLLKRAR